MHACTSTQLYRLRACCCNRRACFGSKHRLCRGPCALQMGEGTPSKGAGERFVLPHAGLLPAALLALDKEQAELPIYTTAYLEGGNVATPRYKPQTVRHIFCSFPDRTGCLYASLCTRMPGESSQGCASAERGACGSIRGCRGCGSSRHAREHDRAAVWRAAGARGCLGAAPGDPARHCASAAHGCCDGAPRSGSAPPSRGQTPVKEALLVVLHAAARCENVVCLGHVSLMPSTVYHHSMQEAGERPY